MGSGLTSPAGHGWGPCLGAGGQLFFRNVSLSLESDSDTSVKKKELVCCMVGFLFLSFEFVIIKS